MKLNSSMITALINATMIPIYKCTGFPFISKKIAIIINKNEKNFIFGIRSAIPLIVITIQK